MAAQPDISSILAALETWRNSFSDAATASTTAATHGAGSTSRLSGNDARFNTTNWNTWLLRAKILDSQDANTAARDRVHVLHHGETFATVTTLTVMNGGTTHEEAAIRRADDENVETIMVDSALVGLVIGRQGENLRRVEQDSGTRIQFITGPDQSGPQRQCKITGNPRARAEAKREINRIINENGGNPARDVPQANRGGSGGGRGGGRGDQNKGNQPALREGENSVQIMVPDRTVGLIIGRGGETIRDLQERSGCHVNIVGENKSINGLRPVNLIGTPQAAAHAKELIMEIVDSDTRTQMQGNQQRDSGRGGGHSSHGNDSYGGSDGGNNKINDTISVPSESVGMIIGKGGETIKEMQNSTGCKINVSQATGPDVEREIGLVGTRSAIEAAKRAIWDKVDTVREKNGARGGGRGGGRDNDNYSDRYSQPQQQPPYAQGAGQGMPPQAQQGVPPVVGGDAGAADPYAAYGGYQNYAAMWYAAMAQQAAQGQGGQQGPPGA
ncbi:hypothetical protein H2199_000011 [Coniosporium tulheliwenetii]|uniref:Uncharacterized protein n=1 Tax=Coniosporium tulheliwenetii TaxID=3383036 RepID=A0ACC2ZNU8_9PEZI|nr:hypothetical protein H2199_000011 [Cladosporium sp. JES 115]